MSKQAWGNATWFMMHTLAQKLRPEYASAVPSLLLQFENVCRNLPCPDCAEHASRMFATANIAAVVDKDSLMRFLYELHDAVNRRLGKPCPTMDECCELYSRGRTVVILQHFFQVMKNIKSQDRAMIYGFRRQQCMKAFAEFMDANLHIFMA